METIQKTKTLLSLNRPTKELLELIKDKLGIDMSETTERSIFDYVEARLDWYEQGGLPRKKAENLIREGRNLYVSPLST